MTDMAERLADVARRRLGGRGVGGLARLSAGATQEIWRFDLLTDAGPEPLILRRAPGGSVVSATAVGLATEAALMAAAAAAGVPVARTRHVLERDDGLGEGFIMSFIEGETLGGRIARGEAFAAARAVLPAQCGAALAQIHSIDPERFPSLKTMAPREAIAQYREAYAATAWPRPVFDLALRWLEDHCPAPPERLCLVHGDFRNGNLIVGPEGLRAVLDWELAHVSDPVEDLAWICVSSWRFGVADRPVGGFGRREDLWAAYEAAGGGRVDPERARFWEAFGCLRWGVMCAGMTATFRGADPNVERAVIARRASETEVDLMRLIAA